MTDAVYDEAARIKGEMLKVDIMISDCKQMLFKSEQSKLFRQFENKRTTDLNEWVVQLQAIKKGLEKEFKELKEPV